MSRWRPGDCATSTTRNGRLSMEEKDVEPRGQLVYPALNRILKLPE